MGLTKEQELVATTLDKPLVVAAGAGSGKTFTLTERIIYAFECGFVTDLDEVCAITFTKKAAGELKSRIKAGLKARGFGEQALKADDAWISTIHGMCARILRANAVELGIDPAFTVAEGSELDALLAQAVDEVLKEASASRSSEQLDRLFDRWSARSSGPYGTSVESMLVELVKAASVNPLGADAFVMPGDTAAPASLLAEVIDLFEGLVEVAETVKASNSRDEWLAATADSLDTAREALERGVDDYEEVLALIGSLKLRKNFGGEKFKPFVNQASPRFNACVMEARMGIARPYLETLIGLAGRALDEFARLKHEAGILDNNDLLVFAARAIEEHESIAARYEHRFKLVMVDEFQDTDQMQVDMIERLAGQGAGRLCTVGDAQQSIYRFRGADVSVYRSHLRAVEELEEGVVAKLTANFRSHGDVLAFVERIFMQPEMFGGEFMELSALRSADKADKRFAADEPRITVLHTSHPHNGFGIDETRKVVARRIASEFSALRQRGHAAGEMVVLLGSMKHAGVYAEALRAQGFACVISGGSVFADTPEAKLVGALLRVIANPGETEPLFNVLTSPLFALCASDLLAVDGVKGFWRADESSGTFDDRVTLALRVMKDARASRGTRAPSRIIERIAVESGWLSRMEAEGPEGLASAGNFYKAVRMVSGIEKGGAFGPVSVMRRFEETLVSSKESPGALSVSGGDSVRLMTVHSSKGLEFPIVAVAEFKDDKESSSQLVSASIDGRLYVSLDAPTRMLDELGGKISAGERRALGGELLGPVADEEELVRAVKRDAGALHRRLAVIAYHAAGEAEEGKRLLYVALTRAKEALVVATVSESRKGDPVGIPGNAFSGIHTALGGEDGLQIGRTLVDFGGSCPAVVECVALTADDAVSEDGASPSADGVPFEVPVSARDELKAEREPYRATHEGVFSYSSISDAKPEVALGFVGVTGGSGDDAAPGGVAGASSEVGLTLGGDEGERAFVGASGSGTASTGSYDERYELSAVMSTESAVSKAGGDDDAFDFDASRVFDEDRATSLGTAFHRLAQHSVIARGGSGPLVIPPAERVESLARSCRLDGDLRRRLEGALRCWFASDVARDAATLSDLAAEVPFFVAIGDLFLEGEIDLLGFDETRERAYVIDYKTGGSDDEVSENLARKHALQAMCYAYAVLLQGARSVEATFVRVERDCQRVCYRYGADDLPALEQAIAEAARIGS